MLVDDEDHEDDYHQGYDDYDDKPKKNFIWRYSVQMTMIIIFYMIMIIMIIKL